MPHEQVEALKGELEAAHPLSAARTLTSLSFCQVRFRAVHSISFRPVIADTQVEALKGELEEAHRAALAAEHRAETEAASAERQRAAAQELTAELERVQVRWPPQ